MQMTSLALMNQGSLLVMSAVGSAQGVSITTACDLCRVSAREFGVADWAATRKMTNRPVINFVVLFIALPDCVRMWWLVNSYKLGRTGTNCGRMFVKHRQSSFPRHALLAQDLHKTRRATVLDAVHVFLRRLEIDVREQPAGIRIPTPHRHVCVLQVIGN